MSFVSNAVMTGFTTGIALQIVAGVASDATGYAPDAHNTLAKIGQTLVHVARLGRAHDPGHRRDGRGLGGRARRTPAAGDGDPDRPARRERRGRRARARRGEGGRHRQHPERVPGAGAAGPVGRAATWCSGAVAVALVALAQAAGIGAAVPNPDGSRTNVSGDFLAQGVANLAGGFFRALPVGGSLSRTGVATSAGARTRWAGVFAGISLAILVIVAGGVAEQIPMPVIGGLILVIGTELIVGRARRHRLRRPHRAAARRWRWSPRSWPRPSSRCSRRSSSAWRSRCCSTASVRSATPRLQALTRQDDGHWRIVEVPPGCRAARSRCCTTKASSFFAELSRLEEAWPEQQRRAARRR